MRLPGAFSWVWLVLAGAVLHVPAMPGDAVAADTSLQVYIGTYTGAKSRGIYWAKFDPVSGELSAPKLAAETRNPTFLALHPNRRFLYAAEEVENFEGKSQGAVSAYSVDEKSGRLSLLSEQPSGGAGPCHLCVDKSGKWLLVANYNNGSIAKLPIAADGSLGLAVATVQHQGASVNPERQAGPHAHFITTDPNNKFALVCDLGLDKVFSYNLAAFDEQTVEAASVKPGFGPRHLAFHPNGRFVFLLNELAGSLTAFSYEAGSGTLKELQTVSTLPENFKAHNLSAEVQVHPSGRFVYSSNRGHDSIAVFGVDPKSGRLTFVERQPCLGRAPRHFALDPSGRWMLVENQDSNNIVVFRVDPQSGRLTPTDQRVEVGSPVCLLFR